MTAVFTGLFALLAALPFDLAPGLREPVQPQLAATAEGVQIVFGSGVEIYTASSDGRAGSAPVRVGTLPKLALGLRRGPRVAASSNGLTVTAISHADGNLHAWRSSDRGASWQEGEPLNTAPGSAREGLHAMAGAAGTVAVVWLDDRAGGKALWSRVSADGGARWQPEVKVYASPDGHICECCHPNLALDRAGHLTAMWRNWLGGGRDFYLSASGDAGRTWSPAAKLGEGTWKLNACPMDGGSLATDATGTVHTVWRRERTLYSATPGQPETKLAEGAAQPVIAAGAGGLCLAWEQAGGIMLQLPGAAATRLAPGHAPALAYAPALHGYFLAWETPGHTLQGQLLPD